MGTYLEMLRVVKFLLDSKMFYLKLCPKFNHTEWNLKVFCDSGWLEIQRHGLALQGSLFIFKMHPFAGALRRKRELLSQAVRQSMLQSLRL
jgi:hypothetical protein